MKLTLVLAVVGLCAAVTAIPAQEETVADKAFLRIQRDVLLLLKNIYQPYYNQEYLRIAKSYNIAEEQSSYTNQDAFQEYLQYYKYGLLHKGEVFSIFYQEHLQEAIALFKLFYYAKDYETFYKTAVWARQYVNEGLFLYSYIVAVTHRPDTQKVVLPPIYEIYPYYFFNAEAIQQAYVYKQQYQGQALQEGGYNGYTINSNYSGYYLNLHPEQSLSYYLEDVGISSYYYYYNIYYPFWLSGKEFGFQDVNRGEQYYFYYQQLLARYYLERLSNGFGEIPYLSYNVPLETPYYPSLEYANGLEFPSRPKFAKLYEYFYNYGQRWGYSKYGYSFTLIRDYERRINDAIDSGYVFKSGEKVNLYSQDGLDILGNLIQSNPDSPNYKYYGAIWLYASHLLGYSYQPLDSHKLAPSALQHFETALRDPVFYQLYKRIILKFQRYYSNIPSYTEKQLVFPGVEVKNFEVDRLVTYYDYFYSDISNAVYYAPGEDQFKFNVRVRQYRLNNKPFNYKVTVQSQQKTKGVVKIFLGPKYDEYGRYINITQNRLNFVLIDYFLYDLKSGENIISRNSYDSYFYAPDATSYYDLYKQVLGSYEGQQPYSYGKQNYFYFPQRYILPKGNAAGVPYQFYVIVYPYLPKQGAQNQKQVFESYFYPFEGDQQFYDSYSLGYPFDRFIKFEQLCYEVPNSYFKEAIVYHKENINTIQAD